MLLTIYNTILYQPLFNLLVFFYNIIPIKDVGLAIILLTILIKIILLPTTLSSIRNQKALQDLQPKLDALKREHKDDKQKLAMATMELYKTEKINPLSSCLPLLIQLPFLIAVYNVFRIGLTTQDFSLLYPFVANPGTIQKISFGIIDWSVSSTWAGLIIAVLAGAAQFVQAKMFVRKQPQPQKTSTGEAVPGSKDESLAVAMNKQMLYFMPVMTVVIGYTLPAGLSLYWLVTTLFTVAQQKYFFKKQERNLSLTS